jgi:hypothetical protein
MRFFSPSLQLSADGSACSGERPHSKPHPTKPCCNRKHYGKPGWWNSAGEGFALASLWLLTSSTGPIHPGLAQSAPPLLPDVNRPYFPLQSQPLFRMHLVESMAPMQQERSQTEGRMSELLKLPTIESCCQSCPHSPSETRSGTVGPAASIPTASIPAASIPTAPMPAGPIPATVNPTLPQQPHLIQQEAAIADSLGALIGAELLQLPELSLTAPLLPPSPTQKP